MNLERGLVWSQGSPQDGAGGHPWHSLDGTTDLSDVGCMCVLALGAGGGGEVNTKDGSHINVPTC